MRDEQESIFGYYSVMVLDQEAEIAGELSKGAMYRVDWQPEYKAAVKILCRKPYDLLLLGRYWPENEQPLPACLQKLVQAEQLLVIRLTDSCSGHVPWPWADQDLQGVWIRQTGMVQLHKLITSALRNKRPVQQEIVYHSGLEKILELVRQLHAEYSLEQLLQVILQHLSIMPGQQDHFVFLAPRRIIPANSRYNALNVDIFMGTGRFQVSYAEFLRQAGSLLRRAISQVIETGTPVQLEDLLILPVLDEKGTASGAIGIQQPAGDHLAVMQLPLQNIYLEFVSSTLHNNYLHYILYSKNEQLESAYSKLEESYVQTIGVLRYLVDAKDIYTRGHSDRVSYFAYKLAQKVSRDGDFRERVRVAGLLHDLGKIGTSDRILCKEERLTDAEMQEIRQHPVLGAAILSQVTMCSSLGPIVCAHHERFDGCGYPYQLAANDIPIEARIIAIADAFDAMMSNRHYRKGLTLAAAIQELISGKDRQFDGELVDIFLGLLEQYEAMREELQWTMESAAPWPADFTTS